MSRSRLLFFLPVLLLALAACSDVTAPDREFRGTVVLLNSVGQDLRQFDVNDLLSEAGSPIPLPENFDGASLDVANPLFTTSISSFGGSQLLVGDLDTGDVEVVVFPGPDSTAVNPSAPTFGTDQVGRLEIFVAGRGDNGVYRVRLDELDVATRIAEDVGGWVERVIPVTDNLLAAIDANLDPDTFQPAGPSRVFFLNRNDGELVTEIELDGAWNATDALVAEQTLVVLAGGTLQFEDGQFVPQANGRIVLVDIPSQEATASFALEGNGLTIRPGLDGRAYVTRTSDFEEMDVLSFDPFGRAWIRGPEEPIRPVAADGNRVPCWTAMAEADGRLLCVTFRTEQAGRIHLIGPDERSIVDLPSGFGTSFMAFRR